MLLRHEAATATRRDAEDVAVHQPAKIPRAWQQKTIVTFARSHTGLQLLRSSLTPERLPQQLTTVTTARTGQVVQASERRAFGVALLGLGGRTLRLGWRRILPVQPRHLPLVHQICQVQLLLLVCNVPAN
jgi:hypothetical protein